MCYDYELEYLARRAEEARRQLKKVEEGKTPKPAAPVEEPKPSGQEEPVPV